MNYSLAFVTDRNGLLVMTALFTIISILVVVLRFWSRKIKRLDLLIDDWLIVISLVH